ncbi:MAG: DUF3390 domain-containing protein, partial [Planctomycetia bacterium]|nr:DUF3390 domain-containing protein [Planctomycetia bacterium]
TWRFFNVRAARYRFLMGCVRRGARVVVWIPKALHLLELRAWTQGRAIPQPSGEPFRQWWRRHQKDLSKQNREERGGK